MENKGILKTLLSLLLIILLIVLFIFIAYFIYTYYPRAAEVLNVKDYNSGLDSEKFINASSEVTQFYPHMRFNHNQITYFILNCDETKIDRLKQAFSIIENETEIISFQEISDEENADIHVGCSEDSFETEENTFIAGEGGPTKFLNLSLYPAILKGKIILYEKSSCDYPITELHEIFHVFGFDHVNRSNTIMYPYVNCKQKIDPELINMLRNLYSIEPKAELYFTNTTVLKEGIYLNFSVQINNEGLIDAKSIFLEIYADDKKVDSFDLKDMEFGAGENFWVNNLKLPSLKIETIKMRIISETPEYNYENNIIEVGV